MESKESDGGMNYKGVVIEESLEDLSPLDQVKILKKRIEKVTPKHKTPWLGRWTLDTVEVDEQNAERIAQKISEAIDSKHNSWYVDFKNDKVHYIVFRNKIFKVGSDSSYKDARNYGISIGIPEYQMEFERLRR